MYVVSSTRFSKEDLGKDPFVFTQMGLFHNKNNEVVSTKKIKTDADAVSFVKAQMERRSGVFNCKDLREMLQDEGFTRAQLRIALRTLSIRGRNKASPCDRAFNAWEFR